MNSVNAKPITLPPRAVQALGVLEDAGFEGWLVGGFVRDALLGKAAYDIDVATNAHWSQAREAFSSAGFSIRETGVKHGTITAIVDGSAVEITTYRQDGAYLDGRRPEKVSFISSIEEDLERRDFTINAIAYHPHRGILDIHGGIKDLEKGIIRTVGDPRKRFQEDALRILRGCRFRAQLGFRIEEDTLFAMKEGKSELRHVSKERIAHELEGLLLGEHVHDAIMETVDVISFVLPELAAMKSFEQKTPYHIYNVLEHTAWTVQKAPAKSLVRWAALLHDVGKPATSFFGQDGRQHFYGHAFVGAELTHGIMSRLPMSTSFKGKVATLVRHHDDMVEPTPRAVKRMLGKLGGDADLFLAFCDLRKADCLAHAPEHRGGAMQADELRHVLRGILKANEAFTVKQLAISGQDVIDLGVAQGPAIGRILQNILEAVVDERIENDKAVLLDFARDLIASPCFEG